MFKIVKRKINPKVKSLQLAKVAYNKKRGTCSTSIPKSTTEILGLGNELNEDTYISIKIENGTVTLKFTDEIGNELYDSNI